MANDLNVSTPSDREILMTRDFAARRDLVFDAWTRPDLVQRWLGTADWPMAVCEIDLRVGGAIRYVWRNAEGTDMGMNGTFREIVRPERLVHTELFDEDWTGGETLVTTTFAEQDGSTTVTTIVLYSSPDARDGALKSGMEAGLAEVYRVLDAFLVKTIGIGGPKRGT